ncbi:FAD-dependent monooxygenase [Streptomyces sp. 549]|uniref:FAD-dependent monooxygenase n=1 Tax=Streptomyces sp. 549 TaxID=3049076 RepID=UPI0024C2D04D|nr:FAD-dependent monooxygenase [Streptomyces sp. 549]MDK1476436.1 FAD-dependent monooxygenase [Streptomyces sp. 549]
MDPVIVVGAGPVGLALALALARHEVPSIVLETEDGEVTPRPARSCVLRPDTAALVRRLSGERPPEGARWRVWRTMRRRQTVHQEDFAAPDAPTHLYQHALAGALRDAVRGEDLVHMATGSRLTELEQHAEGVTARTRGVRSTGWSGSYLVGCDGARSTVRKLMEVRFPGRTAVERHAVAALRTRLPWPNEGLLHRDPPEQRGEICARALPDGVWRFDWLLPPRGEVVTPDLLMRHVTTTLTAWTGEQEPAYELLDTGVHTVHQRLARRWRTGRVFLAGDAAHLLGALGTQSVDEGLRDVDNLAWKLAVAWHHGACDTLLDAYEAERRGAVVSRLRALDQALPLVRGGKGLRGLLPGGTRGPLALLTDGHLGLGSIGGPAGYGGSPLAPGQAGTVAVGTAPGDLAEDVPVTSLEGECLPLWQCLGRDLLVVLVAPGTGVWDSRHWLHAGVMPELAAAVRVLPFPAELLVAENYPGAAAHTVLVVRPDGHLSAALAGVRPDLLRTCAETLLGEGPREEALRT